MICELNFLGKPFQYTLVRVCDFLVKAPTVRNGMKRSIKCNCSMPLHEKSLQRFRKATLFFRQPVNFEQAKPILFDRIIDCIIYFILLLQFFGENKL